MLHAKTMAGTNPVLGLVLLVVLLGVALWVGRRLVTAAFDNFRHLHYTLVFPLFVALRELVRVTAERFQGGSTTPYQLHRGRRIGAVVATLRFAAAGLALALSSSSLSVGGWSTC